jgi:hypothetical protein
MFGMRDAQLEKHSPARKKKKLTAIRDVFFVGVCISLPVAKQMMNAIEKKSKLFTNIFL